MTPKQIERLKEGFLIRMKSCIDYNDGKMVSKRLHQLQDLLDLMYEFYLIDDYKKVQKIRADVIGNAMEKIEMKSEKTA